MKPFNLEQARQGKLVQTRSGQQVQIYTFDFGHPDYQIAGTLENREIMTWTRDGRFLLTNDESGLDLVMTLVKKEGWLNVYGGDYYRSGTIFSTKEEAEAISNRADYITTLKVKWEE